MVRTASTETKTEARRRLTEEMLTLGHAIDRQEPGSPKRLDMLRRQATLSDRREALLSKRH
jgi:hypothetical protein